MVMRLLSVRLALVALGACCAPGVSASGLASAWRRWELPSRDFPDYAGSVRAAEAGEEASSAGRAAARAGGAAGGRLRDLYDGAPGAEAPTGGMRAPAPDVSLADGSSVDAYLLRATRAGPAAARGRSGWRAALRAEQVATATALQNLTVPWGGVALAAARFDVPAPQLRPLVVRDAREALRWVPPPSLSAAAAAAQRAHALPARLESPPQTLAPPWLAARLLLRRQRQRVRAAARRMRQCPPPPGRGCRRHASKRWCGWQRGWQRVPACRRATRLRR